MSKTCHSTSVHTMILKKRLELKKSPIKEEVLNVMVVRALDILDQNALRTVRHKRKAYMFAGLIMMRLKVNHMVKLLSMSRPSLEDVNLMKTFVMRMFLMKNWMIPIESFVSGVKRCVR